MKRIFYLLFGLMERLERIPSAFFGDGKIELIRNAYTKGCVVVGSLFLLMGLFWGAKALGLLKRGETAPGRVMALKTNRASDDDTLTYAPVFTFTSKDGAIHTLTSAIGSNPAAFSLGEAVDVIYEPLQPTHASIRSFGQMWFLPIFLMVAGCLAGLAGYIMTCYARWLNRKGLSISAPEASTT